MNISSILPAYNEDLNIKRAILSVKHFFLENNIKEWEIIVINDGSMDNTKKVVEKIILSEKRVKLINHKTNIGYGEALNSGFKKANLDWIFITDSDLQFFIDDLSKFIEFSNEYNFIQGIRGDRKDSIGRILLGKLYKAIINSFFKLPVSDPECSFRLFKTDLIKTLNFCCNGPMVPIELILNAQEKNAKFKQHVVKHRSRKYGETSAISFLSVKKLIVDFFSLIKKTHKIKKVENIQS